VQLWEKKEGLPVRRHTHSTRASVYAYAGELEAWQRTRTRHVEFAYSSPAPQAAEPKPGSVRLQKLSPRLWALPVALLAFMAVAMVWYARRPVPAAMLVQNQSLAVLPFVNLTGAASEDYLSDGLTDELTTVLSSHFPVNVVARSSAFKFKGSSADEQTIGERLNAGMLVEGSMEHRGGQMRINVRLVRPSDGARVWSHLYDANFENTPAVEAQIERDIASALNLQPPADQKANPSVDQQAYELYLRGEYWWNQRSPSALWKAVDYFNQAIARQPLYSRAYLGLAETYTVMGTNDEARPADVLPRARAAAEKALEIDPTLGEAHAILAHIEWAYDWNYPGAENEFRKAIAANPNFAPAHHWYALLLMYEGRYSESEFEFRRAIALDPLSSVLPAAFSRMYEFAGDYNSGIQVCQQAMRGNANFALLHFAIGQLYLYQGRYSEAQQELEQYYTLSDHDPDALAVLALIDARQGDRSRAKELLSKVSDPKSGYSSAYDLAAIYAALGEKEQAYQSLDKAISQRSPALVQLQVDPAFAPMRSESRFQVLLRRTGHPV
jgi:TolB-like protein/Tfp pilus assembly protein PilF